jgi:hypothetical protein
MGFNESWYVELANTDKGMRFIDGEREVIRFDDVEQALETCVAHLEKGDGDYKPSTLPWQRELLAWVKEYGARVVASRYAQRERTGESMHALMDALK